MTLLHFLRFGQDCSYLFDLKEIVLWREALNITGARISESCRRP